jgi:hypothetical protein
MYKNINENRRTNDTCIKRTLDSDLRPDENLIRNHKYELLRRMRSLRTIIVSNNNVIGTPNIAYIIQIIRPVSIGNNRNIYVRKIVFT